MAYLILLAAIVVVGALMVWVFDRAKRRPQNMETSITDFERRMDALSPKADPATPGVSLEDLNQDD